MLGAGPGTVEVVALDDLDRAFPREVVHRIRPLVGPDHQDAARWIGAHDHQAVILQHEFGIYGGPEGERVLDFVERVDRPIVTVLHTILSEPSRRQAAIIDGLVRRSDRLVVMSRIAAERLTRVHRADPERVRVIDHGVPDLAPIEPQLAKRLLGQPVERPHILSFGLLGPGKGYELAIDAMALVARTVPAARYVILGATHPEQRRIAGETYREALRRRVASRGLERTVELIDAYVDADTLGRWLQAADVYVTPYPGADQIVSGTLAYAVGAGKAVVSTPFAHARDLLADGVGMVTPFGDAAAMARALTRFLVDPRARDAASRRAYRRGRRMVWPAVGQAYRDLIAELVGRPPLGSTAGVPIALPGPGAARDRQPLRDGV